MRSPFLLLSLTLAVAGGSTDRDAVWRELEDQLVSTRRALEEAREAVVLEKTHLLEQLREAESDYLIAQRQWELVKARHSSLSDSFLREPLAERSSILNAAYGELERFAQAYAQTLHPAEVSRAEKLRQSLPGNHHHSTGFPRHARMHDLVETVGDAITRLEALAGGEFRACDAVYPGGTVESGEVFQLGPIAFFYPAGDAQPGWIHQVVASRPALAPALPRHREGLAGLFTTGHGFIALPVDPLSPREAVSGLAALRVRVTKGGLWIFPILAFACLAFGSAVFKFGHLRRYAPPAPEKFERIVNNLAIYSPTQLTARLGALSTPTKRLIHKGLDLRARGYEKLEFALLREVYSIHPELTRFLPFIAIAASASPLLGLLGTVSGMIKTFDVISVHGTSNAQMLSGGIAEALGTTEMGLIVAIPALVAHALLTRRVKWLMGRYEEMARKLADYLNQEHRVPTP